MRSCSAVVYRTVLYKIVLYTVQLAEYNTVQKGKRLACAVKLKLNLDVHIMHSVVTYLRAGEEDVQFPKLLSIPNALSIAHGQLTHRLTGRDVSETGYRSYRLAKL